MKSESSHKLSITKWRKLPLGKLVSYISKGIVPKYTEAKRTSNVVLVLNQRCNRDAKINFQNARWHELNAKRVPAEKYIQRGDILINSTGTGTAGRIAQVNNISSPVTFDGHMILLRAAPNINPFFLGHAIKMFQPIVEQLAEGSTGQTEINRERLLNEIEINFPEDMSIQRKIASILSSLDDKIENNNAICKNLEEQAAALYKSWFVDFEPFGGQKPSGWEEHVLGDYFPVITGKKNANISSLSGIYPFFSCSQEIAWTNEYSFEGNAILVAGNGDFNVKRYCGKFEAYQRTYVLIPEEPNLTGILYQAVKYGLAKITSAARGSVIKFITKGNIADHPVDLPDNHADYPVIDAINTIHKRIDVLNSENLRIATLRDTLLPKLMSGEIDVDKVAI